MDNEQRIVRGAGACFILQAETIRLYVFAAIRKGGVWMEMIIYKEPGTVHQHVADLNSELFTLFCTD